MNMQKLFDPVQEFCNTGSNLVNDLVAALSSNVSLIQRGNKVIKRMLVN